MEMTMTLRSEIEKGIAGMGMNFSEFGEWSGINRGIFSAILNSNPPKPISLNQLERIGKALGHEEGWMFEMYIEECFYDGKPNRRRVEPFLIRCADLRRTDYIEKVLSRLLEDLKQLEMIFEIGEALYTSGRIEQSVVFYQCIVQNEKYHQSERLAISHYRLFRAALGEDNERNLRAAIEFEPFCDKLPDYHRLDGLMRLFDVYFTLRKLDHAERYSQELIDFSKIVYDFMRMHSTSYEKFEPEHPLVVYYAYGFLSMESIMFCKEKFEEARSYTKRYEDLSSFELLDEKGIKEVQNFNFFAQQNKRHIDLLSGDSTVLIECLEVMRIHSNEIPSSLLIILEAANKHGFNVDLIINEFWAEVEKVVTGEFYYKKMYEVNRYEETCYEAAKYFFEHNNTDEAVKFLLKGLNVAVKIKDKQMFMNFVPLFEKNRHLVNSEQKFKYQTLIGGI